MCEAFLDFSRKVHKIAFTDSVHSLYSHRVTRGMKKWIIKVISPPTGIQWNLRTSNKGHTGTSIFVLCKVVFSQRLKMYWYYGKT